LLFGEVVDVKADVRRKTILHLVNLKEKRKVLSLDLGYNGDAQLTPDGHKILVTEKEYVYDSARDVVVKINWKGVVHVYEIATGKEVGRISLLGSLRGISPDSSKAFFISNVTSKEGVMSQLLVTVDLNTYSITSSVPVSKSSYMVFFNR